MTNPNLRDREVHSREVRNTVVRDNDGSAGGLLLGIILASLVGLGAALFFMNQRPAAEGPSRTTIIEKTREVAPQPKAPDIKINVPSPAPVQVPDVNVTVPSPAAPQNEAAPSTEAPANPE